MDVCWGAAVAGRNARSGEESLESDAMPADECWILGLGLRDDFAKCAKASSVGRADGSLTAKTGSRPERMNAAVMPSGDGSPAANGRMARLSHCSASEARHCWLLSSSFVAARSTKARLVRGIAFRSLTFDMRGGRQLAKPDVARPLDGRVRPRRVCRDARGGCRTRGFCVHRLSVHDCRPRYEARDARVGAAAVADRNARSAAEFLGATQCLPKECSILGLG